MLFFGRFCWLASRAPGTTTSVGSWVGRYSGTQTKGTSTRLHFCRPMSFKCHIEASVPAARAPTSEPAWAQQHPGKACMHAGIATKANSKVTFDGERPQKGTKLP